LATASSGTVSKREVERLKESLAEAAVSALDAGLELAKLTYALLTVLRAEDSKFPPILLNVSDFDISLCRGKSYNCSYIVDVSDGGYIRINAEPLCRLAGLSGGVCDKEFEIRLRDSARREDVERLLDAVYEMGERGLLDKLAELLDMAVERAERGEYEYDRRFGLAGVDVPIGGDEKDYKVVVYLRPRGGDRETVVGALRWVRDFIRWLGKLGRLFDSLIKRLEEAGVVDRILGDLLRQAGDAVDSMVQKLGRKRLEERVRYAVKRKVDDLLSFQLVDPEDPAWLRDLAKSVIKSPESYTVSLPSGRIKKYVFVLPISPVKLAEVELPSDDTLADLAVETVRLGHGASASFGRRPLVLLDNVAYYAGHADLSVGDSAVAGVDFESGRHGLEVGARLWVSGLVTLGLAEKVKPGITGEILRWVREALRERIRELAVAEFLYSALREQCMRESPGGG
jgi:hypothetical protein